MKSLSDLCAEQLLRLEIAAEEYHISLDELAAVVNLTAELDLVRRHIRPLAAEEAARIHEFFPCINPVWLCEGRGLLRKLKIKD